VKSLWAILVALLVAAGTTHGAGEIQAQTLLSLDRLPAGKDFRIAVVVNIPAPWHINANPVTEPGLIPTTLTWSATAGLTIDRIVYPPGQPTKVGWSDTPVGLYEGRVVIFAEGRVQPETSPGSVKISGELRYQACDNEVCYAPKSVPVTVTTEIVPAGQPATPVNAEVFGGPGVSPVSSAAAPRNNQDRQAARPANSIDSLVRERGWAVALVVVFLGGLALNLTPCVYPMLAITVSYFGGRGDRNARQAFGNALIYFFGVVLTYSALGLIAALTGGLFGALLQSQWVLIGIAGMLVALALSMFGFYEIRPPQFLLQRATGLSGKAGYVGVFFMGAMVGVIAAPCLAPILVALLVFVGQRGDPWLGWWLFFVLACGLGLPYIVLGTFSGLLTRLPKSGTWMVWVKRVFGVLLIGVALWFLNPLWARPARSLVAWQPYASELVTGSDKPVIVDFAADWCVPCKEMEKQTFSDPRVAEKAKQFRTLKADLTSSSSPAVQKLVAQYNIVGVPTTIFLTPAGVERRDLRLVGLVLPDEFLQVMDKALQPAPTNAPTFEPLPGLMNPF
jgi:thiol:disulfide interchange protein DsbD